MASSVTDSRTYGNFPNHTRLVQGTSLYDVPSVDSRAVQALTPTFVLTAVANAAGGTTAYTGTFSPTLPVNSLAEITGFVNAANNGVYQVVSCNATTLVLQNPNGILETHAGIATEFFPVDSRVAGAPVDSRVAPNIPQNSRV